MNVLMLAYMTVSTSDIPLMVLKALEENGINAKIAGRDEENTLLERVLDRAGLVDARLRLTLLGKRVMKLAEETAPDYVMVYGSNFFLLPRDLQQLKKQFGCKLILWEGNIQFWKWYQAAALKHYDYCFALDSYCVPLLKGPACVPRVFHLGMGCDPDVHKPVELTDNDRKRFSADISFIGSGFANRKDLFKSLTAFDLKLWGRFWDNSPELAPHFIDEPVYGLKKCKIYRASKISLNLQNPVTQINGVSCRIFEILACGGFPLTENKKDLSLYFDLGKEIVTFEDTNDLKDKVRYYLDHPDEREEIARRGRERVLKEHTYKHRMEQMLRILQQNP